MSRAGILPAMCVLALPVSFGQACAGDSLSSDELFEIVARSRACAAGDTCVVAGGNRCLTPVVVNSADRQRVEQLFRDFDCEGWTAGRPLIQANPRCEAGICVVDLFEPDPLP